MFGFSRFSYLDFVVRMIVESGRRLFLEYIYPDSMK